MIPNTVTEVGTDNSGNPIYADNNIALNATQIYNFWNDGGELLDRGFLISKSYVKLRSLVFTWNLPKRWFNKIFIKGASLSVFGNNLLMWTPSDNTFVDPESSSFGNDLRGNYGEYSTNPSSRNFGFNVNVKF